MCKTAHKILDRLQGYLRFLPPNKEHPRLIYRFSEEETIDTDCCRTSQENQYDQSESRLDMERPGDAVLCKIKDGADDG